MKFQHKNKGYTLLFAVLIATLVLGVSVFILSVSTKQYQLSVAARESMYAFYAADSAMECAFGALGTTISTTVETPPANDTSSPSVNCYGDTVPDEFTLTPGGDETDALGFSGDIYRSGDMWLELPEKTCANIIIRKGHDVDGGRRIILDALGYNNCDGAQPRESTRTVERGLRLIKEL